MYVTYNSNHPLLLTLRARYIYQYYKIHKIDMHMFSQSLSLSLALSLLLTHIHAYIHAFRCIPGLLQATAWAYLFSLKTAERQLCLALLPIIIAIYTAPPWRCRSFHPAACVHVYVCMCGWIIIAICTAPPWRCLSFRPTACVHVHVCMCIRM